MMCSRWQTGNQFTTYSALYPKHFGISIAFASELALFSNDKTEWPQHVAEHVDELLRIDMPTIAQCIQAAEDCLSVVLVGNFFMYNISN